MRRGINSKTKYLAFLLVLVGAACSQISQNPTAQTGIPTVKAPTPTVHIPTASPPTEIWDQVVEGKTIAHYQEDALVLYTYYDPQRPIRAHLCLWKKGAGIRPIWLEIGQVGNVTGAALTGDGEWLLYNLLIVVEQLPELWAYNLTTGENKKLFTTDDFMALRGNAARAVVLQMLPIPGTDQVMFNTSEMSYAGGYADDLYKLNVGKGEITTILPSGKGGKLTLSPDSQYLAVVGIESVGIQAIEPEDFVNALDYPSVAAYTSNRGFYPRPNWNPDSQSLLIAIPSALPLQADASLSVYRIQLNGETAELLTIPTGPRFAQPVSFSPNQEWLAYTTRHTPENKAKELHIVELSTGHIIIIPAQGEGLRIVRWMDDSSGLIFQDGPKAYLSDLSGNLQAHHLSKPDKAPQPWEQTCRPEEK